MLCILHFTPSPTTLAPPFSPRVAAIVDEFGELSLRDRRAGDRERLNHHFVSPLLVVENEARIRFAAQAKCATGDEHVAKVVRGTGFSLNLGFGVIPPEGGTTNSKRLPRISDRFVVHVFVQQRQL